MRKTLLMLLTIGLLAGTEGCGSADSESTNQAPTNQATAPQASGGAADPSIAKVAQTFLEAVRKGDSSNATAQLTPLAQQRMRAADMDFELLSSDSASYQVGRVEVIDVGEAIVESVWIELDAEGKPQQENWTLALQQADGKWSILGIVAETGPNQPPVVMDFENPGQVASPAGASPANTAAASSAQKSVPQQATRPAAQDPFRQ